MSRGDLKDLGENLDAGTAGLVAVAAVDMEARVEAVLKRADKVVRKQLKADQDAIDKDVADAEKQAAAESKS